MATRDQMTDSLEGWFDSLMTNTLYNVRVKEILIDTFNNELKIMDFDQLEAMY